VVEPANELSSLERRKADRLDVTVIKRLEARHDDVLRHDSSLYIRAP
jgi:hypothetical protein